MAHVKKIVRADGSVRWRMRVHAGTDPATGKRRVVTRTFKKKKDADREATKLERRRDLGTLTGPSKETLSAYLTRWLDDVKEGEVRARTLHDYRAMLKRHVQEPPADAPNVGAVRLDRLGPDDVQRLYDHLWRDRGLSPRSLQLLHTILRQALTHAVNTGALVRNPTDLAKPKTKLHEDAPNRGAKIEPLDKAQAEALIKAIRDDPLRPLWLLLLTGGLRPSEALGLRWEDVNVGEGSVKVSRKLTRQGVEGWKLEPPKSKESRRTVTLPRVTVEALEAHREAQTEHRAQRVEKGGTYLDGGFVFTTPLGTPLDQANVRKRFRGALEAAELPRRRVYDLRHTHATLLLQAGEHVKVVSERLGHASITLTLNTYVHVLPDMQEEAVRKLDEMFGSS